MTVEQPQVPIDPWVQQMVIAWMEMFYKEFKDYKKSNYALHLDNVRIKAWLEALAQRQ